MFSSAMFGCRTFACRMFRTGAPPPTVRRWLVLTVGANFLALEVDS